jgi:hypothetical protein
MASEVSALKGLFFTAGEEQERLHGRGVQRAKI